MNKYSPRHMSRIGYGYRPYDGKESFSSWLYDQLTLAYLQARDGKRKTHDEHNFELNQYDNVAELVREVINRTYRPGKSTAFLVHKPVDREIFAAHFRDRVIHHFLYNATAWWWDRRMSPDCYSCRVGKGTWYGISRLARHVRSVSQNGTKPAYVIKLDIQGYFMSLDRNKLYERVCWGLDQQFPRHNLEYHLLKFLWRVIIMDDPVSHVAVRGDISQWMNFPAHKSLFCQPKGKGIVIGNLTSQLLSNIYLSLLDHYVQNVLGYKHYGRYVDDFFLIITADEYQKAKRDIAKIEKFLKDNLYLTLHPKKRYFQSVDKGVAFLGAVIYPHAVVPGKRFKRNFYAAAYRFVTGQDDSLESVISYIGFTYNLNGRKLLKDISDHYGGRIMGIQDGTKPNTQQAEPPHSNAKPSERHTGR